MTTNEKRIIKLKLQATEHNAFWWFIKDLGEYCGPKSNIETNVRALLRVYKEMLKDEEKRKYKQGTLPL